MSILLDNGQCASSLLFTGSSRSAQFPLLVVHLELVCLCLHEQVEYASLCLLVL